MSRFPSILVIVYVLTPTKLPMYCLLASKVCNTTGDESRPLEFEKHYLLDVELGSSLVAQMPLEWLTLHYKWY
jgi:hypothetical protein